MLWQARVLAPDLPSMPQPEGAGRPRHRERSVESTPASSATAMKCLCSSH